MPIFHFFCQYTRLYPCRFIKIVCAVLLLSACSQHHVEEQPKPDLDLTHNTAYVHADIHTDQTQSSQPPSSGANASVNEASRSISDTTASESVAELAQWWHKFNRPTLNQLIEQSLTHNYDLSQAMARLRQAQALLPQSQSDRLPNFSLEANTDNRWENGDEQRASFQVGGVLSWEIDAFQRLSRLHQANQLRAQAQAEDVKALRLTLSATVAETYFSATAARQAIDLLQQQLNNDQQLLDLLELRFRKGIGTNVEVLQQKSRVADSYSLIPVAEAALVLVENQLDVLLGEIPDGQSRVPADDHLSFIDAQPSVGIPADLVLNRPDLRALQARLAAADADIAAAIANRFPQITLTGRYAFIDDDETASPIASLLGNFVQPLLDWGKRKAQVTANEALYEEQLANFTQNVLQAINEVEQALITESSQREFIVRLENRRQILDDTVQETEALYTQGIDDYLPVLNALQELRELERQLISQRLTLINSRIALHRALGGATI